MTNERVRYWLECYVSTMQATIPGGALDKEVAQRIAEVQAYLSSPDEPSCRETQAPDLWTCDECAGPPRPFEQVQCIMGNCKPVKSSAPTLQWHYGPTATDPEPGKKWHTGCGGEVMFIDGAEICGKCHMQSGGNT